jgi:hypothetical protein
MKRLRRVAATRGSKVTFSLALPRNTASLRPLMKWSSILVLGALALLVNACEKHDVAELPPEHATAFGEHAWSPKGGSKHGEKHAETKHEEAKAPEAAPSATPAAAPGGAGEKTLQFLPTDKKDK